MFSLENDVDDAIAVGNYTKLCSSTRLEMCVCSNNRCVRTCDNVISYNCSQLYVFDKKLRFNFPHSYGRIKIDRQPDIMML